ncbi:MAG: adenosylhomocysteinase [Candidatus Altiarchaeales archaeon]|nr:adenosylhomocysteinase [Candidatus Altiarchaeales archaeon]MBD3417351.1 adenosylhomocysteinase [Candidatus Altiarchaeales archaeon]
MSGVKDMKLAGSGRMKIEWAEAHMPVLMRIREGFRRDKPLKGVSVGFALHVTKETAVLVETLIAGGAKVAITGCNPLSTQDDVAAALAKNKVDVYAWRGETNEEYYENINRVLDHKPNITIDDGADLIFTVHKERTELLKDIRGGCEETTTGIIRLRAMENDGALKYPVMATNDADTKHMFDNHYGTGQSTIDGILRATSILFAGKVVVVGGYGWCGRGVAARAKGMGSQVIVTEVDPILALRAAMDGYMVMPMDDAACMGDIFITVTGDRDIIGKRHFEKMKSGAVVCNSGHFNIEIDIPELEKMSKGKKTIRDNVERYDLKDGRHIYLLAEGRLVNLAAAEGHPSEVMDMSFANQSMACRYIQDNDLEAGVHMIPREVDEMVARMKLETMGVRIDELTPEQRKYLESWEEGT